VIGRKFDGIISWFEWRGWSCNGCLARGEPLGHGCLGCADNRFTARIAGIAFPRTQEVDPFHCQVPPSQRQVRMLTWWTIRCLVNFEAYPHRCLLILTVNKSYAALHPSTTYVERMVKLKKHGNVVRNLSTSPCESQIPLFAQLALEIGAPLQHHVFK